jgi:hypothetical protein
MVWNGLSRAFVGLDLVVVGARRSSRATRARQIAEWFKMLALTEHRHARLFTRLDELGMDG